MAGTSIVSKNGGSVRVDSKDSNQILIEISCMTVNRTRIMPQPKHDPRLVTYQKLNDLQNTYDHLRNEQCQPTHARELTLRSLNDLINQLKGDLIRMESNSSDESITF